MSKFQQATSKKQRKKLSEREIILIVIASVAVLALLIVAGVFIHNYFFEKNDVDISRSHALKAEPPYSDGSEVFDKNTFKIANKGALDTEALMKQIKNFDEARTSYQLIIQEKNSDEFFEMNYWVEEKGIYEYIFGGYDMGMELDGYYYRTVIDDIPTIIDYQTSKYITSTTDGEFFSKHHSALSDLTLDNILADVLEGDFKTEMGTTADGARIMRNDGVSIYFDADRENPVLMILDSRGDTPVGYYVCYGYSYAIPSIQSQD